MVPDSRWFYGVLLGVLVLSLGVSTIGTPVQASIEIDPIQSRTSCLTYLKLAPYEPVKRTVFSTRSRLESAFFPVVSLPQNPYQRAMCYSGPVKHSGPEKRETRRVNPTYQLTNPLSVPEADPVKRLQSDEGHSANRSSDLNRSSTHQTNDEPLGPRTQLWGPPTSQPNQFKRHNPSIAPLSSILRRTEHNDEEMLSILLSHLRSNYVRSLPAVT